MEKVVHVLGFAGSLRRGSYNLALLRAAAELAPPEVQIETFDLEGIPVFSQDLEPDMPARVKEFKAQIKSADAILIVTPEHNYSVPGVLKNAIDWASRPPGDNSFYNKPVAMMSASTGILGGARAQYHLRQCFVFLDMHAVNRPEIFVGKAADKFDAAGKLNDPKARELIVTLLQTLADWTIKLKKPNLVAQVV